MVKELLIRRNVPKLEWRSGFLGARLLNYFCSCEIPYHKRPPEEPICISVISKDLKGHRNGPCALSPANQESARAWSSKGLRRHTLLLFLDLLQMQQCSFEPNQGRTVLYGRVNRFYLLSPAFSPLTVPEANISKACSHGFLSLQKSEGFYRSRVS